MTGPALVRLARRAAAVTVITVALLLAVAAPASAHAVLEATTPAAGAVVATAPDEVTLRFGETVQIAPTDIRVYDDHLKRVDSADAGHITGQPDVVGVHLHHGLHDGTYTVTYRVISADTHPVSGGFTFSIGRPSRVVGVATGLGGGSKIVGIGLGTTRFLSYVGVILGVGGAIFLLLWPAGRRDRLARRIISGGLVLLAVSTALDFLLQGPYGAGEGLGVIFDTTSWRTTLHSTFGHMAIVRAAFSVDFLIASRWLWQFSSRVYGVAVAVFATATAYTFAHSGHEGFHTNHGLATLSDMGHILAVTAWLGGLVMLLAVVMRHHGEDLLQVLPRFSSLALTSILVVVGTGAYQTLRGVGYWDALTATTYGRLVLAKIGGLVIIVALGSAARSFVMRHYRGSRPSSRWHSRSGRARDLATEAPQGTVSPLEMSRWRKGLLAELCIAVVVLGVTSILVDTQEGKSAYAAPAERTIITSDLRLDIEIDPTKTGPAVIHLYAYTPVGRIQHLQSVTGSLTLSSRDIGPLPVAFTVAGPGHALAALNFAAAGNWRLDVTVQTSPIDATVVTTRFTVR